VRIALAVVAVAACGRPSASPDAGGDATGDASVDAALDAAPDAPPVPTPATFAHGPAPITAWTFPATAPNGQAAAMFVVHNDGPAPLPAIAVTLAGDPSFAIDAAASTCDDAPTLAPHDLCTMRVTWSPTSATDADATLTVAAAGLSSQLDLHGPALPPGAGLVADTSAIDFGVVPLGGHVFALIGLTNASSADIALVPPVASGGFTLDGNNCPSPIPAGGTCQLLIGFTGTSVGPASGMLAIMSSANSISITLDAYVARTVYVEKTGDGFGRLVSVPAGIDCGTACRSASAAIIGAVTLHETPDAGSAFAGWESTCGTDPTCGVPDGADGGATARFAGPGAKSVAFTVGGPAIGQLVIGNRDFGFFLPVTICSGSCTTYVSPGAGLEVYAMTPSKFGGWTGACAGADQHCDLTPVTADVATTVTFARDDREFITLFPTVPAGFIAFAPDDDLVVAGNQTLSKLALDGAVRWSVAIPNARATTYIADLTTAPTGDVYVFTGDSAAHVATLHAFTAAGVERWSHSIAVAPSGEVATYAGVAVNDGQIIHFSFPLSVYAADGTPRWSVDVGPTIGPGALAVSPSGVYHVLGHPTPDDQLWLARYDAGGNALPAVAPVVGYDYVSTTFDATGALAYHSASLYKHQLARLAPDLTPVFAQPEDHVSQGFPATSVAYDSAGNVIAMRDYDATRPRIGLHLEQRSPTGTLLWTLDKPGNLPVGGDFQDGVNPVEIATDAHGRVAVVGNYAAYSFGGWIAIYQMP
jgi:hypothetical protein